MEEDEKIQNAGCIQQESEGGMSDTDRTSPQLDKSDRRTIRYFSMFTGVGGFEKGLEQSTIRLSGNRCPQSECGRSEESLFSRGNIPTSETEQHSDNGEKRTIDSPEKPAGTDIHERDFRNDTRRYEQQPGTKGIDFKCVGYSEIDKYSIQTFRRHFPELKNYGDATKIIPEELPDFDMLCGGYPCQSFSIAGKRRGFADTRGTLFFDIYRIAKEKQPKIIFLENVKGLLNHDGGNTFKIIAQHLNNLGYLVDYRVLNSKYFGVPQNRERVFHIGYNIKWLIKESVEDGQMKKGSLLERMLKGWLLENLLKDLEELKKLSDIKLEEWILNYLKYISGKQTRLEYSKTIKNLQTNNCQNLLKGHQSQLPIKEENSDIILEERKNHLKMVQDICGFMMEKETEVGFIELWQKSILEESLENKKKFITSILTRKTTENQIFTSAEICLIMGWFILQEKKYWENWLNQELSDLIKLEEYIKNEGRRNKGKFRERYLLRNIRSIMGFNSPSDEQRVFIIGSIRGASRPEILPFRENAEEVSGVSQVQQIDEKIRRFRNGEPMTIDLWHHEKGEPRPLTSRAMIGESCSVQAAQSPIVYDNKENEINRIGGAYGQSTRWGIYDTDGISPTATTAMGEGGGHIPMIVDKKITHNEIKGLGQSGKIYDEKDIADTLVGSMGTGGNNVPMISNASPKEFGFKEICPALLSRDYKDPKVVSGTITQAFGRSGCSREEMASAEIVSVALRNKNRSKHQNQDGKEYGDFEKDYQMEEQKEGVSYTVKGATQEFMASNKVTGQLRRLTPRECEKLQGFPIDWTKEGMNEKGEIVITSDTQRYKQMGNAVTTKVIKAIGEKLALGFMK
jgi:DNA (cytosine-5)-methyltransferase 1